MRFGYNGKILHVDLSKLKYFIEYPSDQFYQEFIGGSALALYYVFNNTPAGIDALNSQNTLVIAVSPITGAPISGQSRITVMAKSPLTGCIGDSQAGGFFPVQFKFSGFDAVVITGMSPKPVYLWLSNGKAEIRPASHLWGKVTSVVEDMIRDEMGDPKIEVMQCGIAAENGVRFANIINNSNRANGRNGLGAVMASKNLKAIAVRGNGPLQTANPAKIIELAREGAKMLKDSGVYSFSQFGTAGGIDWTSQIGGLVTRNWSSGFFEGSKKIDGLIINKEILKKRDTCFGCVVRCKPVVSVKAGEYQVDPRYGGPEYETICAFGSYCGIDNLAAISYANQLCNMYGMDTISCGATIAWAMDCFNKGIITNKCTEGIDLRFGNAAAMVDMVKKIAFRSGIGAILSEGSAKASKYFGREAEKLVVAVKDQELPAHMPQLKRSLALIYGVSPNGADHQSSEHDTSYTTRSVRMDQLGLNNPQLPTSLNEEKIKFAFITQCLYSAMDTLDVCQFVYGPGWQLYDTEQLVDLLNAVTGWELRVNDLLRLGEKRINMMRVFNARDGITSDEDTMPGKLSEPLKGGATNGVYISEEDFIKAREKYYELAGWDNRGIPTKTTLSKIGLNWIGNKLLETKVNKSNVDPR